MFYFHFNALLNAIPSTLFGIIAFSKNDKDPKNRAYVFYCLTLALWSYAYVSWQLSLTAASALFFVRLLMAGAILIPVAHLHHILLLFGWRAKKSLRLAYGAAIFFSVANWSHWYISGVEPRLFFSFWPVPGPLFGFYLAYFFSCLGFSLILIYRSWRTSIGYERNLLSWVFWATVIGYGGGATNFPLWYGLHVLPIGNCLVCLYTTTVFYILSRYRLMDMSIIVRQTLVYSSVMGSLMLIYLGTIGIFSHVFEGFTGFQTVFSSAVAGGLMTFCFQPLRRRVQEFVDGKFFRQFVDRDEKLYELSRDIVTHATPETMAASLMHVLHETFHPKSVALYLRLPGGEFVNATPLAASGLPEKLLVDNPLTAYFRDHTQPFVQDSPSNPGTSQSTRRKVETRS